MEIEEKNKEERGITNLRELATVNCVRNGLSISLSFSLVCHRHTDSDSLSWGSCVCFVAQRTEQRIWRIIFGFLVLNICCCCRCCIVWLDTVCLAL